MKLPNEIRIGLLGVVAFVVFILGYNFLKGKGMFSSTRTITAVYDNVAGLKPANRIKLNGLDIGAVGDIFLTDGTMAKGITVEMEINKEIEIPKGSKAFIYSDGVLGTKAMRLSLGNSNENVASGGAITGELEIGMMDKVGDEIDPIVQSLKKTLASLDQTVENINNTLNPSTQQNIKSSVANLNTTTKQFSNLATALNEQKTNINQTLSNLNGFSKNLNKNNGTINKTLANLETTTNNFSKIQLEQTVSKLNTTLNSLQSTLGKVNSGEGSMSMLLNDDKLYKNMKNTSETLNNLLYDMSARPYRYVNLNLFGGKKKESAPLKAPNAND